MIIILLDYNYYLLQLVRDNCTVNIKLLGSERRLKDKTACLLVRVRGLHLDEKHILCDGEPMSGALVDFGLYFFHNVHVRLANGSAPYYYLPKMETHLETRLWNDVFKSAQDYMKVPQGKFSHRPEVQGKVKLGKLSWGKWLAQAMSPGQ